MPAAPPSWLPAFPGRASVAVLNADPVEWKPRVGGSRTLVESQAPDSDPCHYLELPASWSPMAPRSRSSKPTKTEALKPTRREIQSARDWPVLEALGTCYDALVLSGCGMVTLARKSPRGQILNISTVLDYQAGPPSVGVSKFPDQESYQSTFHGWNVGGFRLRETDLRTVSRIFWEAMMVEYSDAESFDDELPEEVCLVPHPEDLGISRLVDPIRGIRSFDGAMDRDFLAIALKNRDLDLPPGKESLTLTWALLEVINGHDDLVALLEKDSDFSECEKEGEKEGETRVFSWTRKYPKDHQSPLDHLGGRQSLGTVRVKGDDVIIETHTPCWAGRFADYLDLHFPDDVYLHESEWKPWNGSAPEVRQNTKDPGPKRAGKRRGKSSRRASKS